MAVRISGVILPVNKRVEIGLTYIFGIGISHSKEILKKLDINPNIRIKDLDENQANKLREEIEKKYKTEGDLRRLVGSNIKRLKEINCYRGIRHIRRLPCRGQRTSTNARTVRGRKKLTIGSGRKKAETKK